MLVCAHIRTKAVDSGTDEALLDQLHCVLSCNALKFTLRVFAGVDFDASLCAAEGHVSQCELESHQRSQGLNFLEIDVGRVSSATLYWELVGVVLALKFVGLEIDKAGGRYLSSLAYLPVAGYNLQLAIVSSEWDVESDDSLAGPNQVQPLWVNAGL